jgi:putative membrane protein
LVEIVAASSIWTWHPHADVWIAVGGLALGYAWALRRWEPVGTPTPAKQKTLFYSGLILLWLAADWPLHDVAERSLFSAHMVQHLVLTFVAPPLMLMGVPKWLLRKLLSPTWVFLAARWITRPLPALLLFNAIAAITHWPTLVDLSIRSVPAHIAIHWALVGSALIMWWPVIGPLPELPRLSAPSKMFYLFLQSILPTVPASFLTFATAPVYKSYSGFDHLWGLSTLNDQRISGLIMKLGGGLLLWSIITYMFFKWSAREEAGVVEEDVSWEDFERELQAWDLRK